METWYRDQKNAQSSSAASAASISGGRYRDRAKERRQKYGIDDEGPRPNRLKEKYLAAVEEAELAGNSIGSNREKMPIDSSNKGMFSPEKSLITIFGHKLKIKNFIKKFDIFL